MASCKTDMRAVPLNPADYFTLVMDNEIRKAGLSGSYGGIVLELDSKPDFEALEVRVAEFQSRFPLCRSRLTKQGKRYYWQEPTKDEKILHLHHLSSRDGSAPRLKEIMNLRQPLDTTVPLEFHVFCQPGRHRFFIRWLHPLCDAGGAGLILKFLLTDSLQERQQFNDDDSPIQSYLDRWSLWEKIGFFIKGKRHINGIDRLKSTLPVDDVVVPEQLDFKVVRFSRQQTEVIDQLARKQVGMAAKSLYYIGCFMRAIAMTGPAVEGDAYCIPYAFNLRKQKAVSPVFGNQVSVLFAQVPTDLVENRNNMFKYLKQQYVEAVRNKTDLAFLPVMLAGSWLSIERYGQVLRNQSRHGTERSSFWFSDIGEIDFAAADFFGSVVDGVFHLSPVTSPPSLSLLLGKFDQKLVMTYNYLIPQVDSGWLGILQKNMTSELLGETR
ncbi:MAG: hypothetical protein V3V31_14135 [Methylococcales bacterium]